MLEGTTRHHEIADRGSAEGRRRSRVLGGIRPGCLHRDPCALPGPKVLVIVQGFSELLASLVTVIDGMRLHLPMDVADGE